MFIWNTDNIVSIVTEARKKITCKPVASPKVWTLPQRQAEVPAEDLVPDFAFGVWATYDTDKLDM